jgi:hypothetical protein
MKPRKTRLCHGVRQLCSLRLLMPVGVAVPQCAAAKTSSKEHKIRNLSLFVRLETRKDWEWGFHSRKQICTSLYGLWLPYILTRVQSKPSVIRLQLVRIEI